MQKRTDIWKWMWFFYCTCAVVSLKNTAKYCGEKLQTANSKCEKLHELQKLHGCISHLSLLLNTPSRKPTLVVLVCATVGPTTHDVSEATTNGGQKCFCRPPEGGGLVCHGQRRSTRSKALARRKRNAGQICSRLQTAQWGPETKGPHRKEAGGSGNLVWRGGGLLWFL